MKKTVWILILVFTNVKFISSQELKGEFYNLVGKQIDKCDCEHIANDETIKMRTYLNEAVFKYDSVVLVYFSVRGKNKQTEIYWSGFTREELRAYYQTEGYVEEKIVSKFDGKFSKYSEDICAIKKDFKLQVMVKGYLITAYKEKRKGKEISEYPVYDQGTYLGITNPLPVIINQELSKKTRKETRREENSILGTIAGAGFSVGMYYFLDKIF